MAPEWTAGEIAEAKRQGWAEHERRMAEAYRQSERERAWAVGALQNRAARRKAASDARRFNKPRSIPTPPASMPQGEAGVMTSISNETAENMGERND